MSLATLLSAEQIIPEMKATERWSAIVELIDLLVGLGKIKPEDRESILASLKQREETMSTGIGLGIAVPHARLKSVERPALAVGVSRQGVAYDSLDDKPVHVVVMIVVPAESQKQYLRILARVTLLLKNAKLRSRLMEAKDAEEIHQILSEY